MIQKVTSIHAINGIEQNTGDAGFGCRRLLWIELLCFDAKQCTATRLSYLLVLLSDLLEETLKGKDPRVSTASVA